MTPQDREDAWLARRIARAAPGGATAKKLAKLATPRVNAIIAALPAFATECDALQDILAVRLADAPAGTVRQYVAKRSYGYKLFNCNEANQTLSEVVIEAADIPHAKRAEVDANAGQAFNQVQIFGPPFVWKAKK